MGSAISFCNNKKRHARTHTHTLRRRIINSQYETELKHPASQKGGGRTEVLQASSNVQYMKFLSPKPVWHHPPPTICVNRKSAVCSNGRPCTSPHIRLYKMVSAAFSRRKTAFAFINILTWIWKLFAAREDQRVQHSWSKECWVRKQTKDRCKRQISG